MILTGQGEPVRLDTAEVSGSLFDILGVRPILGRTFRDDDNQPGKTHIAILGHSLWRQRFGSEARIVGRRITLDGVPYEVVGVMPEGTSRSRRAVRSGYRSNIPMTSPSSSAAPGISQWSAGTTRSVRSSR